MEFETMAVVPLERLVFEERTKREGLLKKWYEAWNKVVAHSEATKRDRKESFRIALTKAEKVPLGAVIEEAEHTKTQRGNNVYRFF